MVGRDAESGVRACVDDATRNPRGEREGQRRTVLDQELDDPADVHLFVFVQVEEPPGELVGSLNLPSHG